MKRNLLALSSVAFLLTAATDYETLGKHWWTHIQVLADDGMEGRNTGSPGHRKAAACVAGEFERSGLKPAGTSGYMQPVQFDVSEIDENRAIRSLVDPEGFKNSSLHQIVGSPGASRIGASGVGPRRLR